MGNRNATGPLGRINVWANEALLVRSDQECVHPVAVLFVRYLGVRVAFVAVKHGNQLNLSVSVHLRWSVGFRHALQYALAQVENVVVAKRL